MTNKMQIISISLLNSKYYFLLNILIFLIIYACFMDNMNNIIACTNEHLPSIAEPKMVFKEPDVIAPIHSEISSILSQTNIILEQKQIILNQKIEIENSIKIQRELAAQNICLNNNLYELQKKMDLIEINKKTIEHQRDVYKESFDQLDKHTRTLQNFLEEMVPKAYISGRNYGAFIVGLIGFSTITVITIAFAITYTQKI